MMIYRSRSKTFKRGRVCYKQNYVAHWDQTGKIQVQNETDNK